METKIKIIRAQTHAQLEQQSNEFLSKKNIKVISVNYANDIVMIHYSEAKPETQPDILDEILVELLPVALSFLEGVYQKALIKTIKPEPPLPNLPNNNMN